MPGPEQTPNVLAPELTDFLRRQERACLTILSDQGVVFVVKLPEKDILTLGGRFPIDFKAELYGHPAAPVIRLLSTFHDRPESPLRLETFINVADEDQRRDFEALSFQEVLYLLFYDERLYYRLSKGVRGLDGAQLRMVLAKAEVLRGHIPKGEYDFDRAKDAVLRSTTL